MWEKLLKIFLMRNNFFLLFLAKILGKPGTIKILNISRVNINIEDRKGIGQDDLKTNIQ